MHIVGPHSTFYHLHYHQSLKDHRTLNYQLPMYLHQLVAHVVMTAKLGFIEEAALSLDPACLQKPLARTLQRLAIRASRVPNDNEKTSMDGRAGSSGCPSPTAGPSPAGGPSPSHAGGYSTFSGREELPDLTEHLKANGIYEDRIAPCSFRDSWKSRLRCLQASGTISIQRHGALHALMVIHGLHHLKTLA